MTESVAPDTQVTPSTASKDPELKAGVSAGSGQGEVEVRYGLKGLKEVPPEGLTRASLAKGLMWLFGGTVLAGLIIFAFSVRLGLQPDDVASILRDVLTVETPIVTIGIAFYLGSDARHQGRESTSKQQ